MMMNTHTTELSNTLTNIVQIKGDRQTVFLNLLNKVKRFIKISIL